MREPLADAPPQPNEHESTGKVLWHFFIHITAGTLLFMLIIAPAVALDFVVHYLADMNVSQPLILIVQFAKYALVLVDTLLFTIFLIKTAYRFAKEM